MGSALQPHALVPRRSRGPDGRESSSAGANQQAGPRLLTRVLPAGFQSLFCSAHPECNVSSYELEFLNMTIGPWDVCALRAALCRLAGICDDPPWCKQRFLQHLTLRSLS